MSYQYDFFVIGAGSGGVRAARIAGSLGAKVAVCEDLYLGGTCVNVGCVPKKLYVYASEYANSIRDAKGFGWNVTAPDFEWQRLRDNTKNEVARLNAIYHNILGNADVEVINGRGRLVDAHTVEVNQQKYTAQNILIATGAWPFVPDFSGKEYAITSNEIFNLKQFPKRLLVVGGGYIAVEFAGIFNGLGAEVTQVYRGNLFLRGFDNDVRKMAVQEITKKGVNLRFNSDVVSINKQTDGSLAVLLNDNSTIVVDEVLYATGRKPKLDDLGLGNVDIDLTDKGFIKVDKTFQTSEPSIYAVGDVIDSLALTPVALEEGMALARYLFGNQPCEMNYRNIATTVFSQPNIGTIGLIEDEARQTYSNIVLYRSYYRAMRHNLGGSDERSMMKILVDGDTDKVVGMHMVGADAGEILQGFAAAMTAGITKSQLDATVGIHPTAAEEFVTMRDPISDN